MNFASWFKGIKGRLLLVAFIPVLGFIVIFFTAKNGTQKLASVIDSAHKELIPNILALSGMRQARYRFGFEAWNAINQESAKERTEAVAAVREVGAEFVKFYKEYDATPSMEEEERLHQAARADIASYIELLTKISDAVAVGTPEKDKEARGLLLNDLQTQGVKVRQFTDAVFKLYTDRVAVEGKSAIETQSSVSNLLLIITLLANVLSFGFVIFISSRISSSVSKIADSLNSSSAQVTTSVEQLREAGDGLSHSSTQAAASLEETVASLEELTSMVKVNSDNAKQAATLSNTSRDSAESGESEIKKLISSMGDISKSSRKIEEIISVIDDIAFQTNLLALNAAVEAARAGEQGRGFAVVAEAVRALALRSASSAKDISALIKESVAQISEGTKVAGGSGEVLAQIVTSIKKVSDLNQEIAAASSEQATGIQQISKAMNQLDQSSQSNAASAEEIAATSSEITNLAIGNQKITLELNQLILGKTDRSSKAA